MKQHFESLKRDFLAEFPQWNHPDFLRDSGIYRSGLYGFLKRMPKGADLHAHADAILPIREQVKFLCDHPELVVGIDADNFGRIRYAGVGMDEGYCTMKECLDSGYSVESFRRVWTILGAAEGADKWEYFESIFTKCGSICFTPSLVEDYYTRVMLYYHSLGIEHLELRCPFFGSRDDALARGRAFQRALKAVREIDPLFTLRIVGCGGKNKIWDPQFSNLMENAMYVREMVKDTERGDSDLLVAIDIVNEEDTSYSLARYEDRIREIVATHPGLKLTLHAGESLRGENNEIAIALRCGIDRLGHGFNLYRYPALIEEVIRKDICIEVCPVSNVALGYCDDLRKHPAAGYRTAGIPVVICSDDAAYQADEPLVADYLGVTIGWDLSLDDIKGFCRESIVRSFLEPEDKSLLLRSWESQWYSFENNSL